VPRLDQQLCQIIDMEKIPDYAAVNETVRLAKNRGERSLVNGVLRAAVREKDNLPYPKKEKNAARYYSVKYSLPIATVRHFMGELGEDGAKGLFESFNTHPPMTLTVNTLKISVDDYVKMLEDGGYTVTRVKFSPVSVRVYGNISPKNLPGFSEGLFIVQDAASALSVQLNGIKKGGTVVDVCAAPGGKSALAAILSGDEGSVYSFDLHESKLSLIEGTSERLGLKSVRVAPRDAKSPDEALFGRADAVICDVPCSGLGVIAKKPDLRYKSLDEMAELPQLQLEILTASAKYVKVGGTLVYSTCTLNRRENEEVVGAFLKENDNFCLQPVSVSDLISAEDGMVTLYPHVHRTDGFFMALLKRKNDD